MRSLSLATSEKTDVAKQRYERVNYDMRKHVCRKYDEVPC